MIIFNVAAPQQVEKFFSSPSFGVAGASTDQKKFGNKVLRTYLEYGLKAYPINPRHKTIESLPCLAKVSELPKEVKSLSIITPPLITEIIVEEAITKGIENIWMQPGAESAEAIQLCRDHGINVIGDGSCVMVALKERNQRA